MRKVVAVDFDDTLALGQTLEPNRRVMAFCSREFDAGGFIVVYTARPQDDYDLVKTWLDHHRVRYDTIVLGKLRFDILVDDRTIHPRNLNDDGTARNES